MGKKKPDRMAMEQGSELTTCRTKLSLAHSGRRQKKKKKKRLQIEGHWFLCTQRGILVATALWAYSVLVEWSMNKSTICQVCLTT